MTAYLIFMALVTILKHYTISIFSLIFIRLKYCLLVACTVVHEYQLLNILEIFKPVMTLLIV